MKSTMSALRSSGRHSTHVCCSQGSPQTKKIKYKTRPRHGKENTYSTDTHDRTSVFFRKPRHTVSENISVNRKSVSSEARKSSMKAYRTAYHRARMVGTAPFTRFHTRRARFPAFLGAFLMATPLSARLGTFRITRVIRGTREATKVLALERPFAGMTVVMRANKTKCTRTRG